jgi:6-phosphogluconolactonase
MNNQRTIIPYSDLGEVAQQTVKYLEQGAIGLSGGSTYDTLFPLWARLKPDCRHSIFFPVDERIVPFNSNQSNWGNAYRKFLSKVGRASDKKNWPKSVHYFEKILHQHFGKGIPIFDVIFLGVGVDGHTASLFPGKQYGSDRSTIVMETRSPAPPYRRLTLSPIVLHIARLLIVIIAGNEKSEITKEILKNKKTSLPILKAIRLSKKVLIFFNRKHHS